MAQSTLQILLPNTPWPGPPGATIAIAGERKQAAAYYMAGRDLQTLTWNLSYNPNNVNANFLGQIAIQASLVTNPTENDWYTIYTINPAINNVFNGYQNLTGNYVWLRAAVSQWTNGIIHTVAVTY